MLKTENITKDEITEMKNEFLLLDSDGDGKISTQELATGLRTMRVKFISDSHVSQKLPDSHINKLINEIDKDGNGKIDLQEYITYMKNTKGTYSRLRVLTRVLIQRSSIRKEFHRFDANGSGHITKDELLQVIKARSKLDLSDHQLTHLLGDKIKDGMINYEEFAVMMTK